MVRINKLELLKNHMTCFDVMYISGGELQFGKLEYTASPDSVYLFLKDKNGCSITLRKTEALCFYYELKDVWISQIDDNIYVEFSGYVSDTLKEMASIAIDELSCSETDISGSQLITNRIKNRFKNWFEEKYRYRRYNYGMYGDNGQLSDKERAYLYFDEKACSELKKSLNEIYGIKGPKYSKEGGYKTHMHTSLPPQPKLLQFNGDYTTVVWEDGSHTVVKRCADEKADDEKAVLFAIVKHLCKDNGCEMSRYLNEFFKHGKILHKED